MGTFAVAGSSKTARKVIDLDLRMRVLVTSSVDGSWASSSKMRVLVGEVFEGYFRIERNQDLGPSGR